MPDVDIDGGLKSLKQSLRRIKSLLAWEQLKHSEARAGAPPTFSLNDSIETDLRNEYSFFLFTSVQIHGILNSRLAGIPPAKCQDVKQKLVKIEQQLYSLNLPQRFLLAPKI